MRSTREIIRLSLQLKLSANEINRITGVSRDIVQKCLHMVQQQQLAWPLPEELDDTKLEQLLFPHPIQACRKFAEPDFNYVHLELKKRSVTRQLLWREYIENNNGAGYSRSQFNRQYKRWLKQQDISMRQVHVAGDKLFVDYSGHRIPVVTDRKTGEAAMAEIFIATLGASNYTYMEAAWSQDIPSWIAAHMRTFKFLNGVTQCLVPDNLKSGVIKPDLYDPTLNKTYQRLAEHYRCSIRPARPYKPKDKAKVEKGVQFVETWALARLRNCTFFSLKQLNEKLQELLVELNNEPFQQLPGTRRSVYETIDLPALKQLPDKQFEIEHWIVEVRVPKDYHVAAEKHYYSVPHHLRGEYVDIRYTDDIVEIFHNHNRVASHPRNRIERGVSTLPEHRPAEHAVYANLTADFFLAQAKLIGPATLNVVTAILHSTTYPQLGFDKCFGIIKSLKKKYGAQDLEQACRYAVEIGCPAYRVVKAALEAGVDSLPQQLPLPVNHSTHPNIRGPHHFN
jgi:transposase